MKEYDIVVIGSGSGAVIAQQAVVHGLTVALVDRGPLGGTCLNLGCIPSKMLIYPAGRVMEIREAEKLGIRAEVTSIDFGGIMERMRTSVAEGRAHMKGGIEQTPDLDFYEGEGTFTGDYTLEVEGGLLRGRRIYLVSGARPLIPRIPGVDDIGYLTNETLLQLERLPESLAIVGGGYIAVEFGHFFSAMGSRVTIVQRGERLVKNEEPEVSRVLETAMSRRMEIRTGTAVVEVRRERNGCRLVTEDRNTGERGEFSAEKVLIAAGRRPNTDLLGLEKTGVETDGRGYIRVNDYLETSKASIWAFGDVIGRQMFRHAANHEANLAWENSVHGGRERMDFHLVPHAVFSYPEIASVGMGEAEAAGRHEEVLVGRARYGDVARGEAMMETEGFAKMILEGGSGRILGFHVIGRHASILIQEVVNAVSAGGTPAPIIEGMHIHPALSELVQATLDTLESV